MLGFWISLLEAAGWKGRCAEASKVQWGEVGNTKLIERSFSAEHKGERKPIDSCLVSMESKDRSPTHPRS